jgi:antitoxin ParD1/3/4
MNVSLTPELEKLIERKLKSGLYNSASEVIREALRLLQERDEMREAQLQELKRLTGAGLKQADEGKLTEASTVFGRIREQHKPSKERHQQRMKRK